MALWSSFVHNAKKKEETMRYMAMGNAYLGIYNHVYLKTVLGSIVIAMLRLIVFITIQTL